MWEDNVLWWWRLLQNSREHEPYIPDERCALLVVSNEIKFLFIINFYITREFCGSYFLFLNLRWNKVKKKQRLWRTALISRVRTFFCRVSLAYWRRGCGMPFTAIDLSANKIKEIWNWTISSDWVTDLRLDDSSDNLR